MANGNFIVQNGLQIGPLTIDAATGGITTTGNVTTTGTITTFINEIVTGTEAVYGNLSANSGAVATSTTTGAFQVVGGAGITGNVFVGGNIVVPGTGYVQVPAGTSSQRPGAASLGMIRYNSTISSFEGFGAGSAWSSLGGVKSVDGYAYITAEASAGAGDDVLRFYSGSGGSSAQVMWASNTNVAILPTQTLTSTATTSSLGQLNVGGPINYGPDYGLIGSFVANIPAYSYVAAQNLNPGGNASTSFTAYNNTGTSFIDIGVNSSNFNAVSSGFVNNALNTASASYAYAQGGEMVVGTWNNNGIHFITNAVTTAGDSMFISGNGNVYISGNLTVSGQQSQYTTITTFLTESANLVSTAYLAGNASTNSGTITQQNTMVPSGTINLGSGSAYYSNAYATNIYGTLQTAAQTNITSVGTLTSLTVSGALSAGSFTVPTAAQPNITSVGTLTGLTVSAAIVPNANASVNLGSSGAWWATIYGTATHAQYADLAENYQADKAYTAGTVVMFGGSAEVTVADADTTRVAGVVSTNPAHLMNGGLTGVNVVPLALQGRVPCMVIGPVAKGDLMVSAGFGYAKVNNNPQCGQVIGKALQDVTFAGKAVIEVVVGRV